MAPSAPAVISDNSNSGELSNVWGSLKNAGDSLWKGTVSSIRAVWDPVQETTVNWFYKTKTITADSIEKGKGLVDDTVKYASDTVAAGREKTGNLIHTVQERQQDAAKALRGKANEQADAASAAIKSKKAAVLPSQKGSVTTTERGELNWVKVIVAAGLGVLAVQGAIAGVALYKNNKKSGSDKPAKKLDD